MVRHKGLNLEKIYKGTRKMLMKSRDKTWVSGTHISNYLLKDPVIDWLNLYYNRVGLNTRRRLRSSINKKNLDNFPENVLLKNGLTFERKIYNDLKTKFGDNVCELSGSSCTKDEHDATLAEMEKRTPIILQAFIKSDKLKLRGVVDILIRSDYINRLTTNTLLRRDEIKNENGELYYLVIDIKWSHMSLCVDGKTIRNEGRYKAYKGQLLIYNTILGELQDYTPTYSYIMPKSWNIDKKKDGYSCYDVLGIVDYSDRDSSYIEDTINAINWVRNVRTNGEHWSPLTPHIREMCCNASNTNDAPWGEVKKTIMDTTRDISQVWMLSADHRNIAFDKNIRRWDDRRCTSKIFGMNDGERSRTIDNILKINQQSLDLIRPGKLSEIKDNRGNWKTSYPLDFFIDYETISEAYIGKDIDIHDGKLLNGYIFMIGVGYYQDSEFKFRNFRCNEYTRDEEYRVIKEFRDFIASVSKELDTEDDYPVRFFHWAHVEKSLLENFFERAAFIWENYEEILWVDMCSVFTNSKIVVKGSLTFKLKDIAKAMYNSGLIVTCWKDGAMSNGLTAMRDAIKYYFSESRDETIMNSILEYNLIDCKVIWDIVKCLRNLT
jgi:hypothetical protein